MFKCEKCGNTTKSGEKQNKKVIKTRQKEYHNEDKYGNDKVSKGYEIVKELNVCEKCLQKMNED